MGSVLLQKYRPRKLEEVIGQGKAIREVLDWLENYRGKGLLAYGPPGVGKTLVAELIAKERGWELIEMNASDFRSRDAVESRLLNAGRQASLFGTGKLLLVDEVDGIAGRQDRGAAGALAELIRKSHFPVYMTCNDNWASAIRLLRGYVREVKFARPTTVQLASFLGRVAASEGIEARKPELMQLATARDVRSALLDLEAFSRGGGLEGLGERDRAKNVFEVVRGIFKARSAKQARDAFENSDADIDEIMLWLDENIPNEYEGGDIAGAYDALSRADVFRGRIIRRQDWSLLKYAISLATAGVALAKEKPYYKFTPYRPPAYLQKAAMERGHNILELSEEERGMLG